MKPLAALLVLVLARAAAAAPVGPDERTEPNLPDALVRIAALPDGGALVVGGTRSDRGPWPYRIVRLDARGAAALEPVPPAIGDALDVATVGDSELALGTRGVAVRAAGQDWKLIGLSEEEVDHGRGGCIVVLDAKRALVFRVVLIEEHESTVVDSVDLVARTASHERIAHDLVLSPAVADGRGGAWVAIKSPGGVPRSGSVGNDSPLAHAHYAQGKWTVWQLPGGHHGDDKLAQAGFSIQLGPSGLYTLRDMLPDGRGGWFGAAYGTFVQVDANGVGTMSKLADSGRYLNALGWDAAREQVLVLTSAYSGAGERELLLTATDRDGSPLANESLTPPRWYREGHYVLPYGEGSMSTSGDTLWIASGPFVFARHGTAWLVRNSPGAVAFTREGDQHSQHEENVGVASTMLGFGGGVAVGAASGSAIHGDGRAGVEVLGGMLGAVPSALLLDHVLTARRDAHPGPGLPQVAWMFHDLACGVGLVGTTSLTAVSAYGVGVALDPPASRDGALDGAFVGAAAGTVASAFVSRFLERRWPERRGLRTTITASLISSAATIGYQLGGGGPQR